MLPRGRAHHGAERIRANRQRRVRRGSSPAEGEAIYAASKAAVTTLTQILAREFAPFGITVNAVGPTPIKTDLIAGVPREKLDALVARQAIPRFGRIEDVANVVDFFLRDESAFVTGQVVYLGGVS